MALDETRTGEPSFGIVDFCVCSKSALDCDDAAIANANIREFGGRAVRQACIADDEIHHLARLLQVTAMA